MALKQNYYQSIAVIGLGYVGLPLALLADKKGYKVYGIDTDRDKVGLLKKGKSPIDDVDLKEGLKRTSVDFETDYRAVEKCSIIIVCVPTPVHKNLIPNLDHVKSVCKEISRFIVKNKKPLLILESTVNPGVSNEIVIPFIEKQARVTCGQDFLFAHCPERINPGDKKWNVFNIPRVVGGYDDESLKRATEFYKSILSAQVKPMGNLKEAEAVKIVENSFRDINIAFVNELALSFSRLGIDVTKVIDGAATKPFSFMAHYPGCGVGGHCIPVDPYYLIEYAKQNGFYHDFMTRARRVNTSMPHFTVEKVAEGLNESRRVLNGTKVAILGLAYKAEVDDTRESPSYKIIDNLRKSNALVETYDPFVLKESSAKSLKEAINGAKAVVLATGHSSFINELTPQMLVENAVDVIVDGRNCLDKEAFVKAGINYKGIGR